MRNRIRSADIHAANGRKLFRVYLYLCCGKVASSRDVSGHDQAHISPLQRPGKIKPLLGPGGRAEACGAVRMECLAFAIRSVGYMQSDGLGLVGTHILSRHPGKGLHGFFLSKVKNNFMRPRNDGGLPGRVPDTAGLRIAGARAAIPAFGGTHADEFYLICRKPKPAYCLRADLGCGLAPIKSGADGSRGA